MRQARTRLDSTTDSTTDARLLAPAAQCLDHPGDAARRGEGARRESARRLSLDGRARASVERARRCIAPAPATCTLRATQRRPASEAARRGPAAQASPRAKYN